MKKRTIVLIIFIIFVLSLIPAYYVGIYAHPSVDDYYYGVETSRVWQETHSAKSVFAESADMMMDSYQTWQGNFSAIFLMRLQPAIFGEQYYVLTPVLLISSFLVFFCLFLYMLLRKWMYAGHLAATAITVSVVFTAFQFTYVPSDSFYWFNGGIYYTFFFSLMLLLFSLVTLILRSKTMQVKILCFLLACPLAFFTGGGNYATALFTAVIFVLLSIWSFWKKERGSFFIAVVALFSLVALLISIAAPGNAVRQSVAGEGPGVIMALLYSFAYGGYNIANSTTVPVALLWVALLPLLYRAAQNSPFSFRHPFFVLLFTFCVYCSQGTPVFYAQGLRMPYRMMNIIYFAYYGFMLINLFYIMGWVNRRCGASSIGHFIAAFYEKPRERFLKFLLILCLFSVGCIGLVRIDEGENEQLEISGIPLSVSALRSLADGSAQTYDRELTERSLYLSTTEEPDPVVPGLSVTPDPIYHTDITKDPGDWKNLHLTFYYGKASIRTE